MFFINQINNFYEEALKTADVRTQNWAFSGGLGPILWAIIVYLGVVFFGPKVMATRKPINVQIPLVLHNLILVAWNAYILIMLIVTFVKKDYSWHCEVPHINSADSDEIFVAGLIWLYHISKLVDFVDTLFFILRKKSNQLTFLHVYHHASMIPYTWLCIKWAPGGSLVPLISINCLVHVVMYSYYALSALGPKVQRFLWWKRYITQMQMIQFIIMVSFILQTQISPRCEFPAWFAYITAMYASPFLLLFGHFYLQSYTKKPHEKGNGYEKNGAAFSAVQNGGVHTIVQNGTIPRRR